MIYIIYIYIIYMTYIIYIGVCVCVWGGVCVCVCGGGVSQSHLCAKEPLDLRGVEWVHGLFLFPLVVGKM